MEIANINYKGAIISDNIIAHDISGKWNSRVFQIWASNSAIGIRNLTIKDNIAYEWRGPFVYIRQDQENVTYLNVTNNKFTRLTDIYSNPYEVVNLEIPTNATLGGNTYWDATRSQSVWFEIDNGTDETTRSFDWWVTNVESNAVNNTVNYVDPTRDISTYMTTLGKTASFETYADNVKRQSKYSWKTEYESQAVNEYIVAGFEETGSIPKQIQNLANLSKTNSSIYVNFDYNDLTTSKALLYLDDVNTINLTYSTSVYNFTGLTSNTEYNVVVKAWNSMGINNTVTGENNITITTNITPTPPLPPTTGHKTLTIGNYRSDNENNTICLDTRLNSTKKVCMRITDEGLIWLI